jgi:hypothetical protein
MKKLSYTLFACLFAIGLLTAACDNPLSDALDCLRSDISQCNEDYTECTNVIDTEIDTAAEEQTACKEDLCDCIDDTNCDDLISNSDCN